MRIGLFSFVILWLAATPMFGQRLARLKKGNELYAQKQYAAAITEYEALMASESGTVVMGVDAKINLADCYRQTQTPVKAEKVYRMIADEANNRPDILLNFGEVLVGVGKFDEARTNLQKYTALRPDDPRAPKLIEKCDLIQAIRPVFYDVKITNQEVVNDTTTDEFGLSYYGNGIVFASNQILKGMTGAEWKGVASVDMLYAEINPSGDLLAPRLLSKRLNSVSRHDGPATFTRDGKTIIYSQSVKPSINAPEGTLSLHLFTAKNENGKWSKPEALPFNIPDLIFTHPCLSADGTQLFFVSNMSNGGLGGLDIWVSSFRAGRWTNPRNLGATVNTTEDEGFPFIHPDGTLYFSSKGHANYGGYDLFRAQAVGNGADWQKAENLGEPINTAFDDTYFLLADDQTNGYLASARGGTDDIYRFILEGAAAKPLPDNVQPRSAAIFNDSSDAEVIIVETQPANKTTTNTADNENFVDKMLAENPKTDTTTDNNTNTTADGGNKTNNGTPKKKTTTTDNTDNTDNNDNSDIVENPTTDNVETPTTDTETPDNEPTTNNNTPKKSGKNGKNSGKNKTNTTDKPAPQLVVELQVIDSKDQSPLDQSEVVLRNAFTGKEEKLRMKSDGIVVLTLQADQKYEVIASCAGYFGGRLPITTMGAYADEKADALFPLVKKD